MPIVHEGSAISVTAVAVEFDHEPAFRPHEVDPRPRAAHCLNRLIKAEQWRELGIGTERLRQPLLDVAQGVGQAAPRSNPRSGVYRSCCISLECAAFRAVLRHHAPRTIKETVERRLIWRQLGK